MAMYKNMFYDETAGHLVNVDLDLEDMIIREPETMEDIESQAVEVDIKNGYKYKKGYDASAMISAPLIYELSNGNNSSMEDDIAEMMETDSQMGSYRNARGAFQTLFNNYIYTCEVAREHKRHYYTRHRYQITSGAISRYKYATKGLNLQQDLLGGDGSLYGEVSSYSMLSNVYSGGDTCHWGLREVGSWRRNAGKAEGDPATLAKSHDLFKAGIGNNDLTSSNTTKNIPHSEMLAILDEFKTEYVDKLVHRGIKRAMQAYLRSFRDGLEEREGNSTCYNANQLASILERTPNFYIEDYL